MKLISLNEHTNPILLLLLFGSLLIRVVNFGSVPSGLTRDEASLGYTAHLLLEEGVDEHGRAWPLKFESFGDWKQPVYVYLLMPLVWLFGLSPTVVRLPSLFASLGMMILTYQFMRIFIPKSRIPAYAAILLLGFNPWYFHFSHVGLEVMVGASLFLGSILLLTHPQRRIQIFGWVGLLLTILSYHGALVVVPLWAFGYLLLSVSRKRSVHWIAACVFILITVSMFWSSWNSAERAKVSGTSVFSMTNQELWENIYSLRSEGILSSFVHNKYVYWATTIGNNYLKNFSPDFLLFHGGDHMLYDVDGWGNITVASNILMIVGVIVLLRQRSWLGLLLLMAFFIGPLPAAVTYDGAHSTRSFMMIPFIQMSAAVGFWYIYAHIPWKRFKYAFTMAIVALWAWQAVGFVTFYWNDYRLSSNSLFSGYFEEMSKDIHTMMGDYERIYITFPFESPYIFYAFYTQMDANTFLSSISYYPKDAYGFVHAKSLSSLEFPKNMKDLRSISDDELASSLIVARVEEVDSYSPIMQWSNALAEVEVVAIEGSDL